MTKFTDNLWRDLVREHGPSLLEADQAQPRRARALRRPRILAGSSLGLAGVGAALVLVLGGSTAAPAFAVTKASDGSVLVHLNYTTNQNLPQVDAKLASMGIHEDVIIQMAIGRGNRQWFGDLLAGAGCHDAGQGSGGCERHGDDRRRISRRATPPRAASIW